MGPYLDPGRNIITLGLCDCNERHNYNLLRHSCENPGSAPKTRMLSSLNLAVFGGIFKYTMRGVRIFLFLNTGWPKKNGTVDFLGLFYDQKLSFFTLLDRTSFLHYNNTKTIKFG